jgi:enamidase
MKLRRITAVVLATVLIGAVPVSGQDRPLALVGGGLVDGSGASPVLDATVLVRGDTIVAAGHRSVVRIPAGAEIVDVSGMTVLPGLIDGHVHLGITAFMGDPTPVSDMLRVALEHGVTTVVDLGNAHPWILQLRDSVSRGLISGPRILAAGAVITAPGGHPAGTWLKSSAEAAALGTRQVATPDAAREAVRGLAEAGVDVIKVVYDGGSERSPFGIIPRLDSSVMAAALEGARAAGRPAFVHWQQSADLGAVLAARPDVLVHLSIGPLPPPAIGAIVASGAIVQATAVAFAGVLPEDVFRRLYLANLTSLVRGGARLSVGTDAPLSGPLGGGVIRELELLVEAGLTPARALGGATALAAAAVGRGDLGRIRPGARADLLVVEGDPTQAIAALRNVRLVVAAGRIVVR